MNDESIPLPQIHFNQLPPPARYFPLEKGVYEVGPGLSALGRDFGNGVLDSAVFQFDSAFGRFRQNKLQCREERFSKYVCTDSAFGSGLERRVCGWIAQRLVQESPALFSWQPSARGGRVLLCSLTGDRLEFSEEGELVSAGPYRSAWDALACQVEEDLAVVTGGEGADLDRLVALHLCAPGHWAAEEKIGKNFRAVHAPVGGVEKMNRSAPQLVRAMIEKGPYVRFVWGFATDERLNHHPEPPPGEDPVRWHGRKFDQSHPEAPFSLRVERQTLFGFPKWNAALFTIRVSFVSGSEIRNDSRMRSLMISSLKSMLPEHRAYKGLDGSFDALMAWLSAP
jgi:hypothetical protein